jgi:hypothetical protein
MRLVWSKEGSPQTVSVPAGSKVWDAFGNTVNANGSVMVEKDPHLSFIRRSCERTEYPKQVN